MNKNLSLKIKQFFTLIALLYLTACVGHVWEYEPQTPSHHPPLIQSHLNIPPFIDERTDSALIEWSSALALFPFVPYSKARVINLPDQSFMGFEGSATNKLRQALSDEIIAHNLFKTVSESDTTPKNGYILSGTLKKFRVKSYWSFYGLSIMGIGLWYLGAPAEKIYNDVIIEFTLSDKNGKVYFQKEYIARTSRLLGFYYNQNIFQFEESVKSVYLQLMNDLHGVITKLQ